MAGFNDGRPLTELISSLAGDITTLFRKEVQLAKAEASEKISDAMENVVQIVIGAVLAIAALGVLLAAIVSGLAAILVSLGMTPPWASALAGLVVAIVFGLLAWLFVSRGIAGFKASKLKLERTATSLSQSASAVKEKF